MMFNPNDIEFLKYWLKLARTIGTDAIKIVAGPLPDTYPVTIIPQQRRQP